MIMFVILDGRLFQSLVVQGRNENLRKVITGLMLDVHVGFCIGRSEGKPLSWHQGRTARARCCWRLIQLISKLNT